MIDIKDWLYTKITIPNLVEIKTELVDVFWKIYDKSQTADFISFDHHHAHWSQLLALQTWLYHNDMIRNRWVSCYFSVSKNKPSTIHVDYTASDRFCSINIPLINCHDSYTVWYDVDPQTAVPIRPKHNAQGLTVLQGTDDLTNPSLEINSQSFWYDHATAVEIDRVPCDGPMLINISRPHRPVVNHDQLRVLFSLRLFPCSFDLDVRPYL